jgi:hypothetical protein
MPSDISATEGAAANVPANVLGFHAPPAIANNDTIVPPRAKRISRSGSTYFRPLGNGLPSFL